MLHICTPWVILFGTSRYPQNYADLPFPLLALDVNDQGSIDLFLQNCKARLRIDVLVNNAGVGITGAVEEVNLDALRAHFDTNFGPLAMIQQILPLMRKTVSKNHQYHLNRSIYGLALSQAIQLLKGPKIISKPADGSGTVWNRGVYIGSRRLCDRYSFP